MTPVSVRSGLGGRGQNPVTNTSLSQVGITHIVRWKPQAMSHHRRAVCYNFSQPERPEKKIAQAIPRPMATRAGLRAGALSGHLMKRCYQLNLQIWQEQQWHPVRAWPSSRSLLHLLWPQPLSYSFQVYQLFISRRPRMGWKAKQAMLLMPRHLDEHDKHCLFPCTRWTLTWNSKTKQHKI